MPQADLTTDQVLTMLTETPVRLADVGEALTPAALRTPPAPGEWSAVDVLAHLRSCSDVWGESMRALVSQDAPTLRAVNPTTWILDTDYPELVFAPSLKAFTSQRSDLLEFLEALPAEAWNRTGTFTGAGRPLVRDVLSFSQRLAWHERQHVRQLAALTTRDR